MRTEYLLGEQPKTLVQAQCVPLSEDIPTAANVIGDALSRLKLLSQPCATLRTLGKRRSWAHLFSRLPA